MWYHLLLVLMSCLLQASHTLHLLRYTCNNSYNYSYLPTPFPPPLPQVSLSGDVVDSPFHISPHQNKGRPQSSYDPSTSDAGPLVKRPKIEGKRGSVIIIIIIIIIINIDCRSRYVSYC